MNASASISGGQKLTFIRDDKGHSSLFLYAKLTICKSLHFLPPNTANWPMSLDIEGGVMAVPKEWDSAAEAITCMLLWHREHSRGYH